MGYAFAQRAAEPAMDVWPQPFFNGADANYYPHRFLVEELIEAFHKLEIEKKLAAQTIARYFVNPSRVTHLMYLFLVKPATQIEVERDTLALAKLLESLAALRRDTFCEDGKNLVWAEKDISEIELACQFRNIAKKPQIVREVSDLSVALTTLCELYYFANLAFGREIHGPYSFHDKTLIVRDFYDLVPAFWGFPVSLPFRRIQLLTTYEGLTASFDFSGRMYTRQSLPPLIRESAILVDGAALSDFEGLGQISVSINDAYEKTVHRIAELDTMTLLTRWVEAFFWAAKPLMDAADVPWQPPQRLYDMIRTESPDRLFSNVMRAIGSHPPRRRADVIARIFDPRLDRHSFCEWMIKHGYSVT
jgi:hypothetical protein